MDEIFDEQAVAAPAAEETKSAKPGKATKENKDPKETDDDKNNRRAAVNAVIKRMEKEFGKGSLMRLGEAASSMNVETIPTGIMPLDIALGVGGVPRGRIIEIYGPESSGKTTVTLHIIAETQKNGGIAAFIDAEHALDPLYAQKLGVNIDDLLVSQPDNGEQALDIVDALVNSGAVDIVVVDSVAALVPKAEIEGDMGAAHVGLHARLMSQAMRKLTAAIGRSRAVVIFINQVREKVGVMYGNPEVTTGGRALKFYSSLRMEVRKFDTVKQGADIIGNRVRVKVVKNKVAPPFRQAEFDIMYGEGVSKTAALIDTAALLDIIEKSGAWYSYGEQRLGQGRNNARLTIEADPALKEEIENKIREAIKDPEMINRLRGGAKKKKGAKDSAEDDGDEPVSEEEA